MIKEVPRTLKIAQRQGPAIGYEYQVRSLHRFFDLAGICQIEQWIKDNNISGGFEYGYRTLAFDREEDRMWFLLRWTPSK